MTQSATIPFSTIVHALREAGMQISVREVLEGIAALETIPDPFGYLSTVTARTDSEQAPNRQRLAKRDQLVWLVQTLWARSEAEREIVRRTIEHKIAPAPALYAIDLRRTARAGVVSREGETIRPPSPDPLEDLTAATGEEGAKPAETEAEMEVETGAGGGIAARERARINVPVPPIEDTTLEEAAPFELEDVPMLDELALASIWRRFRQPVLKIDHGRPDVERSIDATVRAGGQLTIVPARRRVNNARLLVALDVGVAMAPWATMRRQLEATLDVRASRLEEMALWYFSGVPGEKLYADPGLRRARPIGDVLGDWTGAPMLVFGEAGAARVPSGSLNARLAAFLARTRQADIRPVVWINPMPQPRWPVAFSRQLEAEVHVAAFALGHENLIAAVTVMREQAK